MQSCYSPIASASAAALRVIASICFNCHAAELPACIRFSCYSPLAFASAAALVCVRFSCTASRLCPFRLLLPDCVHFNSAPQWRPLRLLLPDCFRFNSAVSTSSAAPRLHPLQLLLPDCVRFGCCSAPAVLEDSSMSTILEDSTQSSRFSKLKYEGRTSL